MSAENLHPSSRTGPRRGAGPGVRLPAPELEDEVSLRSSIERLRHLAGTLAEIPGEIRAAPARATAPRPDGMFRHRPRRPRKALRSAAWPLAVAVTSGALAVAVVALTDGIH